MLRRPRRLRTTDTLRNMVAETQLSLSGLICPLFVEDGTGIKKEIVSMPGIFRYSPDTLLHEVEECMNLGLRSFVVFPRINEALKTNDCLESVNESGLYIRVMQMLKREFPEMCLMSDVALDPYSGMGHDGLVDSVTGKILNDETLELLARMAVLHAYAGADIVGPSDMMDGRVAVIRQALDYALHKDVSIMSYTAKYASAFYGPFRDALDSAPKAGDKKTYQMNPANRAEAMLEARLDFDEGADILMVKPALAYLDIISDLKQSFSVPIAAYNVSGEYAMVKAASLNGWLDYEKVMQETLLSIKRAGADVILTYFAKDFARIK